MCVLLAYNSIETFQEQKFSLTDSKLISGGMFAYLMLFELTVISALIINYVNGFRAAKFFDIIEKADQQVGSSESSSKNSLYVLCLIAFSDFWSPLELSKRALWSCSVSHLWLSEANDIYAAACNVISTGFTVRHITASAHHDCLLLGNGLLSDYGFDLYRIADNDQQTIRHSQCKNGRTREKLLDDTR